MRGRLRTTTPTGGSTATMTLMKFARTLACLTACLAAHAVAPGAGAGEAMDSVERWGTFEVCLSGPSSGNPFIDVRLTAAFTLDGETHNAAGVYDGSGAYRIRCMPPR